MPSIIAKCRLLVISFRLSERPPPEFDQQERLSACPQPCRQAKAQAGRAGEGDPLPNFTHSTETHSCGFVLVSIKKTESIR